MTGESTAYCTKCKAQKDASMFSPSRVKSGRGWCRECVRPLKQGWIETNKELSKEVKARSAKKSRQVNPEASRDQSSGWRERNPQAWAESRKRYRDRSIGELLPWYLASHLDLTVQKAPPELLELKREQLTVKRLSKQIKTKLKETK